MSSSEQRERVLPDNGRQETRWVMLTLVLVLLAGVVGIQWRQQADPEPAAHAGLSTAGTRLLTELSIAAEEIRFMTPTGESLPSATRLGELGVPPFERAELDWQQPQPACYLTFDPDSGAAFALWLAPEGGLFFAPRGASLPSHCRELAHWTRMDKTQ